VASRSWFPHQPGSAWFEFLYELGAISARGDDIRAAVFDQAA